MADQFQESAKQLAEQSRHACWELAKCLFAANTGAAAAILLLLRSDWKSGYFLWAFIAFCIFCFGVFAVVVSYYFGAVHAVEIAKGFQKDCLGGKALTEVFTNHGRRLDEWKSKAIAFGGLISLLCLIAGGLTAIVPLYNLWKDAPAKAAPTNQPAVQSQR